MLGNNYSNSGPSNINSDFMFLSNEASPRPQPRQPPVPTPFNQDRPQPTVPDVSLIFNSPLPSFNFPNGESNANSSRVNSVTKQPRAQMSPPELSTSLPSKPAEHSESTLTVKLIKHLLDMIKAQGKTISRMDRQIQLLHENQEKHFLELQKSINHQTSVNKTHLKADAQVQTESNVQTVQINKGSGDIGKEMYENGTASANNTNVREEGTDMAKERKVRKARRNKSISPPKTNTTSDKKDYQELARTPPSSAVNNGRENTEDLSTILRDLELPSIKEQSVYSSADNSIGNFDLHEYNCESIIKSPGIGASVSEYEISSSSGEEDDNTPIVQPTATFYRNVLGNVNRLLDGSSNRADQTDVNNPAPLVLNSSDVRSRSPVLGLNTNNNNSNNFTRSAVDTTLYGFPSNYLSFATKQYLQRHGLINSGSPNRNCVNPNQNNPFRQDELNQNEQPSNDRILDLTALKNQPKLI